MNGKMIKLQLHIKNENYIEKTEIYLTSLRRVRELIS